MTAQGINVLSLFDGMSCGQLALIDANIKYNNYFASEIKPHAIHVTQHNFPNTVQLGDVCNIDINKLPRIDLLIGGSPCQDLSRGHSQRDGLEGEKSKLYWEYVDKYNQLKEINPDLKFLLENVVMPDEDEGIISETFNVNPLRINSQLVSPQLRDRLYWTNIGEFTQDLFGRNTSLIKQPKDCNIKLQSILTDGYTDREKSRALLESDSRPLRNPQGMSHRYFDTGFTTVIFKDEETYYKAKHEPEKLVDGDLRYMYQEELEQCQTVPIGYTSILKRDDAACLLGDGWTTKVISHILKHLKETPDD